MGVQRRSDLSSAGAERCGGSQREYARSACNSTRLYTTRLCRTMRSRASLAQIARYTRRGIRQALAESCNSGGRQTGGGAIAPFIRAFVPCANRFLLRRRNVIGHSPSGGTPGETSVNRHARNQPEGPINRSQVYRAIEKRRVASRGELRKQHHSNAVTLMAARARSASHMLRTTSGLRSCGCAVVGPDVIRTSGTRASICLLNRLGLVGRHGECQKPPVPRLPESRAGYWKRAGRPIQQSFRVRRLLAAFWQG